MAFDGVAVWTLRTVAIHHNKYDEQKDRNAIRRTYGERPSRRADHGRPAEATHVSVVEAAQLLGISKGLAYEMVEDGRLDAIAFGPKRWRVPSALLLKMLRAEVGLRTRPPMFDG
jgi:excisionase family DNA binding protein